jgi:hypothetical protein
LLCQPQLPIKTIALITPPFLGKYFQILDIRIGKNSCLLTSQSLPILDIPMPISAEVMVGQTIGINIKFLGYNVKEDNNFIKNNEEWEKFYLSLVGNNKKETEYYKEIVKLTSPFRNFNRSKQDVAINEKEGISFRGIIAADCDYLLP